MEIDQLRSQNEKGKKRESIIFLFLYFCYVLVLLLLLLLSIWVAFLAFVCYDGYLVVVLCHQVKEHFLNFYLFFHFLI